MPIGTAGFLSGLKTLSTGASAPRSGASGTARGGTINAPFSVGRGGSAGLPNMLWLAAGGLAVWWLFVKKRRRR
jgi:hypothetical protein